MNLGCHSGDIPTLLRLNVVHACDTISVKYSLFRATAKNGYNRRFSGESRVQSNWTETHPIEDSSDRSKPHNTNTMYGYSASGIPSRGYSGLLGCIFGQPSSGVGQRLTTACFPSSGYSPGLLHYTPNQQSGPKQTARGHKGDTHCTHHNTARWVVKHAIRTRSNPYLCLLYVCLCVCM